MALRVFAISFFALLATPFPIAHAETLAPGQPLNSAPTIARYILSNDLLQSATIDAAARDRDFGIACTERYTATYQTFAILSPVEMAPNAVLPSAGVWRVGYDVTRCGSTKRYNNLYGINNTGALVRGIMVPGESIASIQLQGDVMKMTITILQASRKAENCAAPKVFETRISMPPQPIGTPWQEEWTILNCGPQLAIKIDFKPTPDGGTDFAVRVPAAAP